MPAVQAPPSSPRVTAPQPAPAPAVANTPAPAAPQPAPQAYIGDRFALVLWLGGAATMAVLLLKDLILALFRL